MDVYVSMIYQFIKAPLFYAPIWVPLFLLPHLGGGWWGWEQWFVVMRLIRLSRRDIIVTSGLLAWCFISVTRWNVPWEKYHSRESKSRESLEALRQTWTLWQSKDSFVHFFFLFQIYSQELCTFSLDIVETAVSNIIKSNFHDIFHTRRSWLSNDLWVQLINGSIILEHLEHYIFRKCSLSNF